MLERPAWNAAASRRSRRRWACWVRLATYLYEAGRAESVRFGLRNSNRRHGWRWRSCVTLWRVECDAQRVGLSLRHASVAYTKRTRRRDLKLQGRSARSLQVAGAQLNPRRVARRPENARRLVAHACAEDVTIGLARFHLTGVGYARSARGPQCSRDRVWGPSQVGCCAAGTKRKFVVNVANRVDHVEVV